MADARRRQEAERLEALRHSAEQTARDRSMQEAAAEQQKLDLERQVAERREKERLERLAQAQAQSVEQNTDVLSMLQGGV